MVGVGRDVDKSRVAGNLPGCESTVTRLINWGINLNIIVSLVITN